ncbi:hypothetical protein E4T44_04302 [Aureobasidium sp. EXF-8845]|nr:hypothetical protein E4T45_06707 [Aureobasidium sp. EXF-8846]KAI4847813.1 hypothetical protein E4T44_04302 [Aureobasidium sp. EXF-8845]
MFPDSRDRSDLDVAVSVSMALRKNDLVVKSRKAKRSIQHCRDMSTHWRRRDLLHFPSPTRAVQGPPSTYCTVESRPTPERPCLPCQPS